MAAQQMAGEIKKRLDTISVYGEVEGGAIKITATANKAITAVEIQEEFFKQADREELEELMLTAINKALSQADQVSAVEMQAATQGMLGAEGKKFLFDPFIKHNPLASHIDTKAIKADYILISHGHGDHIADLVELAQQTGAMVIGMVEVVDWIEKKGIKNIHPMNFGKKKFDFGNLRMVWATHSSSMPDGSYGGNPAGFVLETAGKTVYFAGDTSLNADMKILPDLHKIDYAILPIGGNYTMDVDDALLATKYIQCDRVIGVHYNTFPVIEIDTEEAQAKFKRENKQLLLPAIGETIEL
eukprot:gene10206-12515_t